MDSIYDVEGPHRASRADTVDRENCALEHPRRIPVAVAHRHKLYLQGLVRLLEDIREVHVVGQAETEQQFIECMHRVRPEVAICEPFVPGFEGLHFLEQIQTLQAGARMLLILDTADPALLSAAFRRGVRGYLSVNTTHREFAKSIQAISKGEPWVERRMMHRLLLEGTGQTADATVDGARAFLLSPREREIAGHAAAGLCNKRIAGKLNITESTVKAHLVNIFRKFDIHHRTQLAGYVCHSARVEERCERTNREASPSFLSRGSALRGTIPEG